MFLIVGLGNPGQKYERTRHNIGFQAIYQLARKFKINATTSNKFKAVIGRGIIRGIKVILVQPLTYMNKSGEAVKLIMDYYQIPLNECLVIYDDLDLTVGKIRIKTTGSAGGHKGLRSIINKLDSNNIPRIRIGIDHPPENYEVADYVLSRFNEDEEIIIKEILSDIDKVVEEILLNGYEIAMNKYN